MCSALTLLTGLQVGHSQPLQLAVPPPPWHAMDGLQARGWHTAAAPERWNAYAQATSIGSFKSGFKAAYTNLHGSSNSLLPQPELSYTLTATLFAALRLWPGAELYVVPELIGERPLSSLLGLGGVIQNAELQKTGTLWPLPYLSRLFLRQSWNFGGTAVEVAAGPMQLGSRYTARRLVLQLGKFSILDFFDKNAYSGDLRRQMLNMAHLTYAAYDFAADARGYAWGAVLELYWDKLALRLARLTPPLLPNQLPLDFHLTTFYGDQFELDYTYALGELPGKVHLLGYRNRESMGRFDAALAAFRADPADNANSCTSFHYGSHNATAPDLCWVRQPHLKVGLGVAFEQALPAQLGWFLRAMRSDGQTEVYSYTATDASLSTGLLSSGALWQRAQDSLGLAYACNGISAAHASYLQQGGVDGFIGDGNLQQANEQALEIFYSMRSDPWVWRSLWLSLDYQFIWHPAYNAARGPLHIVNLRLHVES